MKKKEFNELKSREISDLKKMVKDKQAELVKLGLKIKSGEEKNLKKAANLRREVAQIVTLITEKEILERKKGENI